MRIAFATEGGIAFFPGLSQPAVIDTANLPDDQAQELQRLIAAADFFNRPATPPSPPAGAADYQQYTITVDDGARHHSIRLADPVEDASLQALVNFLRRHATRPATLGEESAPARRPARRKRGRGDEEA